MKYLAKLVIMANLSLPSLTLLILTVNVGCEPYKPGEPGGPWTDEEISIVREKVKFTDFTQYMVQMVRS